MFQLLSGGTLAKIKTAKTALTLLNNHSDLVRLCLAASEGNNYTIRDILTGDASLLDEFDKSGLTPLIYGICFNHKEAVELLVNLNSDVNLPDELIGWTPLMWAAYIGNLDIVTALLNGDADPQEKGSNGKTAIEMAKTGSPVYRKLESLQPNNKDEDLDNSIKLQTAGVKAMALKDTSEDDLYKTSSFGGTNEVYDGFDFDHLTSFVKFHESSIPDVVDYIFQLPSLHPHKPVIAAGAVFQCMRWGHVQDSDHIVDNFLDFFFTRLRGSLDSTSGVISTDTPKKDIVLVSYWVSVVNLLYYYTTRDAAIDFVENYPHLLQQFVDATQFLVAELAFAINGRLQDLVDDCLLKYKSVPDLKEVSFKKDWFKRKPKKRTTYDEILLSLYPPSVKDQMKPSPIKVNQTLGALLYVMELHDINSVTRQQTLSAVLYWLGCTLFNKVLENKSSRSSAIQIRLNISTIEDWLRSNNLKPFDQDAKDAKPIPDLKNVAWWKGDINSPQDAAFYYNSLFKIGKHHLTPVCELLQWLQVMTSLPDLESLKQTLTSFLTLTPQHLLKSIKSYRYEVDEKKFQFSKYLREVQEPYKSPYFHFEGGFLNADYIFPVALSNKVQMLHMYMKREFQPFLPISVSDSLDEIYDSYEDEGVDTLKNIDAPTSVAYKTWDADLDDDTMNPWA